jgi:ankyrin repeat protein
MIATAYEKDKEKYLKSENSQWTQIDLVNMYEVFVDKKLLLYLTEKMKADISNSCVLDDLEEKKERYLADFEVCALVAILPPSMLKSLHNKKIKEKIQPFLDRVQAGKDKTGVVMNVVDGKPQFVHRTFAEFFTARWFSRNFKDNRSVLEDILFDSTYLFMTNMFYAMLVKDCPLHCAALQRNYETVNALLEEGCDLNAVDKGGRTFMHVLATGHSTWWFKMNRNSNYEASLHNTDSVLQWTPLQYAVKSKNWSTVERLLESNVDRSGLDMIIQRAQDPDYIDGIISLSVLNGHLLLLEFLSSIGVNIYEASSRIFPSPLHAAIQAQQLKVIRLLIQHGADCNTRYSDLQTPLFYAVTKSSLDIVQLLVEEGGASLDIRDDKGRTVTDWAEEYASLPACQRPFPWEYRVDRSKEIVKYLQERKCDVFSSVRQNSNS